MQKSSGSNPIQINTKNIPPYWVVYFFVVGDRNR